jgi:hypothetical protein
MRRQQRDSVFCEQRRELQLDDSQRPSEASNSLDLRHILYGPTTNVSFPETNNSESGRLTVTDGMRTANVVLPGDYSSGTSARRAEERRVRRHREPRLRRRAA